MKPKQFIAKNGLEVTVTSEKPFFGTKEWFENFLKDSSFIIKDMFDGSPAMFLKHKDNGKTKYRFICKKRKYEQDYPGHRSTADGFMYVYPCKEFTYQKLSMFKYPLPEDIKEQLDRLIMDAVEAFREWYQD